MSCGPVATSFRLLDGYVGWSAPSVPEIDGTDREGASLELALRTPGAIDPAALNAAIPPRRLARGCGPCEWFCAAEDGRLLRLRGGAWYRVDGELASRTLVAIAARGHWLAASDGHQVFILARSGEQLVARIPIANASALAFTPWDELLVAVPGAIQRFDLAGVRLGTFVPPPPADPADRLAVGDDCALWLATRAADGTLHLWRAARGEAAFASASLADLTAAFPGSDVGPNAASGCGIPPEPPPARATRGQLQTTAIDSGTARTKWHRVRIDADVPPRTKVEVEVAAMEDPTTPDDADWQSSAGELDFLIRQPPGRYLYMRITLTGDGTSTPHVRRIRLDLPRSTSLEHLPAVYRETPEAEDFTERFLSLFDATIEQIDGAIARSPALLDAGGVPDGVLPWLGTLLDIAFDPSWTDAQRRRLLAAAPALYRIRGTREGLIDTIRTITGVEPAIRELALERSFAAIGRAGGTAILGHVRLFSRSGARFRVGASRLGGAPVESFGNPDQDPLTATAFRFQVLAPPQAVGGSPLARARLQQLVTAQRPAHTVASLRIGGDGFVLGVQSAVGIDTVLGGLPAPVLGKTVRLGRMSALAPSREGCRVGFVVGRAAVGSDTVMRTQ